MKRRVDLSNIFPLGRSGATPFIPASVERFNEQHGEALLQLASTGYKASDFFPEQAKSHTLTNEDGMELPLLPGEEP